MLLALKIVQLLCEAFYVFLTFTANSATTSYGGLRLMKRDQMICKPLATALVGKRHQCSERKKPGEAAGHLPAEVWVWRWSPLTL